MRQLLPEAYIAKLTEYLGKDADAFWSSYDEPRTQGLRLNPLKVQPEDPSADEIKRLFELQPVPWCPTGFYYDEDVRPGRHPFHAAGLYYIQEPSAMSAVELLDPRPGEVVLDLAAAPGGKSTQIAGKLGGTGLLIANEIHPARAKILSENIERMGVANTVVTNEPPDRLAARFPAFFDRIMLDAPCSGEGMFRKDPDAIGEWSPSHVEMCAARQTDILAYAVRMLKPGGVLAYSTCTFSTEENEAVIARLTADYPEFELLRMERLWPHLARGEGHFVAVLRKNGTSRADATPPAAQAKRKSLPKPVSDAWSSFEVFAADALHGLRLPDGEPILFGEQLYWLPHAPGCPFGADMLRGLRTVRPGLHLAAVKKNRIEPAHALALAIHGTDARDTCDLLPESPETAAFLKGEVLAVPASASGWLPVTVQGYPLGWGKASGGQLKNHYPKGLRRPG